MSTPRVSRTSRAGAILSAAALLGGCVNGTYRRVNVNEPRSDVRVESLTNEPSELQDCLNSLGAPNLVWPVAEGTALGWTHLHERGWRVRASVAAKYASATVQYNTAMQKAQALVLFFDDDWNLLFLRRGKLGELLREHPRRVQPVPLPEQD